MVSAVCGASNGLFFFFRLGPFICPAHFLKLPPMLKLIQSLVHAIVQVLRRLWQKITGRIPVPVRVRAFSHLSSPSSSRGPLNDFRGTFGASRRSPW